MDPCLHFEEKIPNAKFEGPGFRVVIVYLMKQRKMRILTFQTISQSCKILQVKSCVLTMVVNILKKEVNLSI